MPKREDEYWAGMKEPKGRGLCPFCGSSNISYNTRFHSWRCNKCEHSFPTPSYGPGGQVTLLRCPRCGEKSLFYNGREQKYECLNLRCKATGRTLDGIRRYDRYMTPEETTRAAKRAAEKQRGTPARIYSYSRSKKSRGLPGWLKPILVITILAMFGSVVWGLFGSEIADFFSSTPTGPQTGVSEPPPEEPATSPENSTDTSDTGEQTSEDNGDEQSNVIGDYYLGLVYTPEGVLGGSECYGEFIVLINNERAVDPSYNQLLTFLQQDRTDQFPYQYTLDVMEFYYGTAESRIDLEYINDIISGISQPSAPRICADFAERLHYEAEMAGIRCAYVSVELSGVGHALNAFQTTDRGLIYIDDTGKVGSYGPTNCDKVVDVRVGQQYVPISLFPEPGWSTTWESIGTVTDILITWDGEWKD